MHLQPALVPSLGLLVKPHHPPAAFSCQTSPLTIFSCRSMFFETASVTTKKCKWLPIPPPPPVLPAPAPQFPPYGSPLLNHLLPSPSCLWSCWCLAFLDLQGCPRISVPALLLLMDLHGPTVTSSPLPRDLAGDGPQGEPTSAWGALCPLGSFQSAATPSLQGLCPASQEAAGHPSLSSRGSPTGRGICAGQENQSLCPWPLHVGTLHRRMGEFDPHSQGHPGAPTSPSHFPLLWEVLSPPRVSGAAAPTHLHQISLLSCPTTA